MSEQDFKWYYSTDGGERYYGPCDTRDEAIAEGTSNVMDDEPFMIIEATKGKLCLNVFDDIGERIDDANEDMGDPDGDPISSNVPAEAWSELQRLLHGVTKDWADRHNVHANVWQFAKTRNEETINPSDNVDIGWIE